MTQHLSLVPPAGASTAEAEAFRQAMRQLAGGVAVITAGRDGERAGLTATAVTSFSAEPPTIIACVNRAASAAAVILRDGAFGVNLLSTRHVSLAKRFAGAGGIKGAARYEEGDWTQLETGAPILADALAALDCELEDAVERHSHTLLFGRVRAVRSTIGEDPLLYWQSRYRCLAGNGDDWTPLVERRARGG